MENRTTVRDCSGQSVAEYAVVLALVFIIAVTVLLGVGQRSRARLVTVDTVLGGRPSVAPASVASAAGGAADTSGHNSGDDQGSDGGSGSNQVQKAAAEKH